MGNCLFGGMWDGENMEAVKVITPSGCLMEFNAPITAGCIAKEFPGHAIFPDEGLFWRPLSAHEELTAGLSYYLLPHTLVTPAVRQGHVRSKTVPISALTPYRMSVDCEGMFKRSYASTFAKQRHRRSSNFCRPGGRIEKKYGYWKVKLVINPEQLSEILSREASTEELIESARAVANSAANDDPFAHSSSTAARSDHSCVPLVDQEAP